MTESNQEGSSPPPIPTETPLLEKLGTYFKRAVLADFQRDNATDAERSMLANASPPITDPTAQNYASWRRSALWFAVGLLVLHVGISIEGLVEILDLQTGQLGLTGDDQELIEGVFVTLFVANAIGVAIAFAGAFHWRNLRKSRRLIRRGWMVILLAPALFALIPIKSMLEFRFPFGATSDQIEQIKTGVGLIFGLQFFMQMAPKFIAIFPGIIRSSMTLKTLLPESASPGWTAAYFAPIYALFLTMMVVLINQMMGSFWLVAGVVCFMMSPMLYLRRRKDLLRPHTEQEVASVIRPIRRQAALTTLAGVVILVIYFADLATVDVFDILSFFISVGGSVLLMNVVGCDFILAAISKGHEQAKEFAGTDLEKQLHEKFDHLRSVGLTKFETKEPEPESAGPD